MNETSARAGGSIGMAPVAGLLLLVGLGFLWPLYDGAELGRIATVATAATILGILIALLGRRLVFPVWFVVMLGGSIALDYLGFADREYAVSWVASMLAGLSFGVALLSLRRRPRSSPSVRDGATTTRTQRRATDALRVFIDAVERERRVPEESRETGASDDSLAEAADRAQLAHRQLSDGLDVSAAHLMVGLGDSLVDTWHPDATPTGHARQVAKAGRAIIGQ